MFDNFGGFAFAQDFAAQDLTVTYSTTSKERDEHGQPIKHEVTEDVHEQIVNNNNPNITFTATDGGQYGMGTLVWQSRLHDVPRGATLKPSGEPPYTVVAMAQDRMAGLTYYALKRLEVAHK